jgi:hypothetical protein
MERTIENDDNGSNSKLEFPVIIERGQEDRNEDSRISADELVD